MTDFCEECEQWLPEPLEYTDTGMICKDCEEKLEAQREEDAIDHAGEQQAERMEYKSLMEGGG